MNENQNKAENIQKIAFVSEGAYRGGVERTLVEWIKTIPSEKYEVTLYLMNLEGELLGEFPDFVKIKKILGLSEVVNGTYRNRLKWVFQNSGVTNGLKFIIASFFHKISHNRGRYYRTLVQSLPTIDYKYDYVISYTMPDSICISYVAENIVGNFKWMWSHIDVGFYKEHELDSMEMEYEKFDKIINVSMAAKKTFDLKYPQLAQKSVMIRNHLDIQNIIKLSLESCNEIDKNITSLLTVARFTYQKGQDIAIEVAKKLVMHGIRFKWYFIGPKADNGYFISFFNAVKQAHLEENIIYLGETDNPYKYMKNCDIYIQPSRFEGYCTTVTEAKILNKPVIMTDVAGAREQIRDGVDGIIVSFSVEDIENKLRKIITDKTFRMILSDNLKKHLYNSDQNFEDIISILKKRDI